MRGVTPAPTPFPNTYSLDFDGVDDYVDCGNNFSFSDQMTISCWVKMGVWKQYESFVTQNNIAGSFLLGQGIQSVKGSVGFAIFQSDTTYKYLFVNGAAPESDWFHLVGVADGSYLRMYVNGVSIGTPAPYDGTIRTSTDDLYIGGRATNNYYSDALIDEVAIWEGTGLSAAQVLSLYNSGTPTDLSSFAVTPLAWYRCGDSGEYFNGNWELPNQPQLNNWSSHSMDFDGVNDYVDFGNDSVLDFGTTSFSISFWIKTTDSSGAVLAKGSVSGQSKAGYKFEMAATNKIQIWNVNQSVVTTYLTSTVIVSDGAWHHIVASYDRGAANLLSLYIDGSLDVTKDITSMGDLSNIYNLFLGKQDNGAYWDGGLDEVSVFNSTLDASTITSIYNSGEPTDLSAFSLNSFKFDGVDDNVNVKGAGYPWWSYLTGVGASTMSFWIKSGGGVASMRVLEKTGQFGIFQYGVTNTLAYYITTTSGYVSCIGGAILDDTWHHCAMIYDGANINIYEDGSLVATSAQTGTFPSSAAYVYFGAYSGGSYFLDGSMDDIAIFDSAKAIGDLWDGTGKPTDLSAESGLIGYWIFDNALYNGATTEFSVPDLSSNSADGTTVAMDLEDLETDAPLSPVAYYRLGEDSYWDGTNWWTPDYSKNTLFSEKSFNLDGVDDYISMGNPAELQITGNLTLSAWIMHPSAISGNNFIVGRDDGNTNRNYSMWSKTTGAAFAIFKSGVFTYAQDTVTSVDDGNWHHIMGVNDGTDLKLYIDGVLKDTNVGGGGTIDNDTVNFTIGDYVVYSGDEFEGNIDDVAVFNTDKSGSISTIYNSGVPSDLSAESGLIGYWRMGEGITNWNGTNWQLPDYSKNALFSQKSFAFDGVNDRVAIGTTSLGITSAISVSAWVKIPTTDTGGGGTNIRMIVCEDTTSGGQRDWGLFWRGTGYDYFQGSTFHTDGSSSAVNSTGITPNDGNWHHLLLSFDGTTDANGLKMYVDGTLFQATAGSTGIFTYSGSEPTIGSLTGISQWAFLGNIDEVSVFDAVKVVADVSDGTKSIDLTGESDMVAWWRMGEDATFSTNWTIPDASTNSNTGTSVNMDEVDLEFNTPTNPNAGLSSGMDEVDLEFNTPTNLSAGLSSGMAIDDKVNNAPDNINQGLSSNMDEVDRVEDTPPTP